MTASGDEDGHRAVTSCVFPINTPQDKCMDLKDGPFGYRLLTFCNIFDIGDGFLVIDGFQVLAHAFPANGKPFFHYECGFHQGQGIAFDAVAFVSVFNVECFPNLGQRFLRQGAQRVKAGFKLVYFL